MEIRDQIAERERNWAMFCHLAGFAGFLMPYGGIIGPLLLWHSRKDESEWVNFNGKESLNFQLSILLYTVLAIPLVFIVIGIPILVVLGLLEIICVAIAATKSAKGEVFKYPVSIPFFQ